MPKSLYSICSSPETACTYNRIYLPTIHCKSNLTLDLGSDLPKNGGKYDAIQIHGLHDEYLFLQYLHLKVRNKLWVSNFDDDYKNVPNWNGVRFPDNYLSYYDLSVSLSDYIICSTPYLASTFNRANVLIGPNLVDMTKYPITTKVVDPKKITILWQGSTTHSKDLEIIIPALDHVLSTYNNVEFICWGSNPPNELYKKFAFKNLIVQEPVSISHYHHVLNTISPDIVLAPLVDCEFNRSKSNLRIIEGWASQAAVLASNVGEYKCIRHDVDGLLANDPIHFKSELCYLIENDDARLRLQQNGFSRVQDDFCWQNPICRKQWDDIFNIIGR